MRILFICKHTRYSILYMILRCVQYSLRFTVSTKPILSELCEQNEIAYPRMNEYSSAHTMDEVGGRIIEIAIVD